MWKIAYKLLGGNDAKPKEKDIQMLIAYIAELNEIDDVSHPGKKMYPGKTLIVPAPNAVEGLTITTAPEASVAGASEGNNTPAAQTPAAQNRTSAQNRERGAASADNITLKPEPDLQEYEFEDLQGDNAGIKKWTKNGADDVVYTADIAGLTNARIEGATPEEVKKLKTDIEAKLGEIKDAVANETEDAKAERQAKNMQLIKEIAQMSGYDTDVVVALLSDKMLADGVVDVHSDDYNKFLRGLINTKNTAVFEALAKTDETLDNYMDKQSFERLGQILNELFVKERNGEILTEDEYSLKNNLKEILDDKYCEYDAGGNETFSTCIDTTTGKTYYNMTVEIAGNNEEIDSYDKALLDNFVAKLTEVNAKIDAAEDSKKEEVKTAEYKALFKEYVQSHDEAFASSVLVELWEYADDEDKIKAINNNGPQFLAKLGEKVYKDANNDTDNVKQAFKERALKIYTEEDKGNPQNMLYISNILNGIPQGNAGSDVQTAYEEFKTQILDPYFEITTDADNNKQYTYKGRRLTKEEAEAFYEISTNEMDNAICETITMEDIGPNGFAQAFEYSGMAYYEKFVVNMTTKEEVLEFLGKIQHSTAVPFDKIMEKFGDDADVRLALIKRDDIVNCAISNENRIKLIKDYIKEDGTVDDAKLKDGVNIDTLIAVLPDYSGEDEIPEASKPVFDAIVETVPLNATSIDNFINKLPNGLKYDYASVIAERIKIETSDEVEKVWQSSNWTVKLAVLEKVDISKSGDKTELQNMACDYVVKDTWCNLAPFVKNGWLEEEPITSDKKGKSDNGGKTLTYYRCGDKIIGTKASGDSDRPIKLYKANGDNIKLGLKLYACVDGLNFMGCGHKNAKEIIDNMTKDNVDDIIRAFNLACKKDDGDNYEGILEFIIKESIGDEYAPKILKVLREAHPDAPKSGSWKDIDDWIKANIM